MRSIPISHNFRPELTRSMTHSLTDSFTESFTDWLDSLSHQHCQCLHMFYFFQKNVGEKNFVPSLWECLVAPSVRSYDQVISIISKSFLFILILQVFKVFKFDYVQLTIAVGKRSREPIYENDQVISTAFSKSHFEICFVYLILHGD